MPDPVVIATWKFGEIAARTALPLLTRGEPALAAAIAGAQAVEDDPAVRSVGYGGLGNRMGTIALDASVMDGRTLRCGAVAAVENVRHVAALARLVMEKTPHLLLAGEGARLFAVENGFPLENLHTAESVAQWYRRRDLMASGKTPRGRDHHLTHDTVTVLALDKSGSLGGVCTTSGLSLKLPGRVGDSPIIGAGTYADGLLGAASCTGWGEAILRVALAHTAVAALAGRAAPDAAAAAALAALRRVKGFGGLVIVDRRGRAAARFNTPRMARGIADALGIRVAVDRGDRAR